jgi:hypothetical protein
MHERPKESFHISKTYYFLQLDLTGLPGRPFYGFIILFKVLEVPFAVLGHGVKRHGI